MKTPRLNTEIYVKLSESAQNKDKAAQRKQQFAVKSAVPVLQALVDLKKSERSLAKLMKRKRIKKENIEAETISLTAIKSISPQLHTSLKALNTTFSEIMRKRKSDVCISLGQQFKPYASGESSEDWLFDDAP